MKRLKIKFQRPLNEEEEEYLISFFQGVLEAVKEQIDKIIWKLENRTEIKLLRRLGITEAIIEIQKTNLEILREKLMADEDITLFSLNKNEDGSTYYFTFYEERYDPTLGIPEKFKRFFRVGEPVKMGKLKEGIEKLVLPKINVEAEITIEKH